jgi:hypothetical protein
VPRAGVTPAELVSVLSRQLGLDFQVGGIGPGPGGQDEVMARRSPVSAVVVRIGHVPGGRARRPRLVTVGRAVRRAVRVLTVKLVGVGPVGVGRLG